MVERTITLFDFILSATYIVIFLTFIYYFKSKIKDLKLQKYFKWFFSYKILTSILFVFIYVYYYRGGDTFLYFSGANFFVENIIAHPDNIFSYLFSPYEGIGKFSATSSYRAHSFLKSADILLMSRITTFFCALGFKKYMATTLLFSMFFGIGHWLIFLTFYKIYPQIHKYLAIGTLFFPSLVIWNSGILKDTVILAAIGVIFYSAYLIANREKLILPIIAILLSSYACLILKPYVLYLFIPTVLYWLQSLLQGQFKGSVLRLIITPLLLVITIGGGYFFISEVSSGAGKYSLDKMEERVKGFHSWHGYLADTRDQSGYSLGEIEYTASGVLQKVPASIFVTYFRPFPLVDTRNIANWFEGMQSFILLLITLYVILKVGPLKMLRVIYTNKTLLAFLFFALAFGFAVGFTSYNFGALSRYKTPALPFYTAALAIIYYEGHILKVKKKNALK